MVKKINFKLFVALFLWVTAFSSFANVDQKDPKTMIESLSTQILSQIEQNREALNTDSAKVKELADQYVLPYVDTPKMARYVMGQYWKQATVAQKNAFTGAFTDSLLRSYSKSILKLKVTQVDVTRVDEDDRGRASITTEVLQSDGNRSTVVYRAYLNKDSEKWMLYDVSIEGISMLLNYRKTFASEFDKKGIDQVIDDLNKKNQSQEETVESN